MTKKDFELIAKVIRGLDQLNGEQKAYVACKFSVHLECVNPQFNFERFRAACVNPAECKI